MANITSSLTKGNKEKMSEIKVSRQNRGDRRNRESIYDYNMEQYGEFVPSFNSWILMDDQRKRIEEITEDDESLWKTKE